MANDLFIYEFLFRGGETSSPDDDSWHVVLARNVEAIDGSMKLEISNAMPPDRAAELGFTLDSILSSLNSTALANADAFRSARDEAQHSADEAVANLSTAQEALRLVQAQRDALVEALQAVQAEPDDEPVAEVKKQSWWNPASWFSGA